MVISTLPLPALYELERIGNAKNSFYLGFRRDFIGLLRSDLSGIEETFAQFSIPYDKEQVMGVYSQVFCAGFTCAGGRREKAG